MAHRVPLNHIFTIPFATRLHQHDASHQPHRTCPHNGASHHQNGHCQHAAPHHHSTQCTHHQQAHHNHVRHHTQVHGRDGAVNTTPTRKNGTPLLLAMSLDSKILVVADSLHMISIFAVGSEAEKLTLAGIRKVNSNITALAITEGGNTVLFVEDCAPATLKMFNTSTPANLKEVNPVHEDEVAQVVSCSISSHFILASFYSKRTSTRTMALWRRAHNKIDSELTHVFTWDSERIGRGPTHLYRPIYVTEWHTRRDHSKYYAEVAYHVDNQLVYHPEVGNEECRAPSCISMDRKPIALRIDQSHGRDCVYALSSDQLRIYRVDRRNKLCLTDSVVFGDGICSSAVCGVWTGNRNRHVTVARIVNGQVLVFRAQLPSGVRFQLA